MSMIPARSVTIRGMIVNYTLGSPMSTILIRILQLVINANSMSQRQTILLLIKTVTSSNKT